MLIAVIGENCTGKSTLANQIQKTLGGEIVTGKDYLRLAKSPGEAERLFRARLLEAVSGENLIYVISEPEHLALLPEGAVRVLVTADLETIQARFRARMRGNLPAPVAQMLARKHGMFDSISRDSTFDGVSGDAEALCAALRQRREP